MRKMTAILVAAIFMAAAIVMYIYWQNEAKAVTKGVLVSCPGFRRINVAAEL